MSSAITYREAIVAAIGDEMEANPDVFLLGEDVAVAGGVFKLTEGLLERFGEDRVLDTPISEQAIIGTAIGAAASGLRPIAEIMFADFAAVCFDGIANELAKYRYMTDGQVSVPVTIRMAGGAGAGFAAQHSQPVENWFLNVAGLKIAMPGTPADAYGLLRSAIRDEDPVLVFEHKGLFNLKSERPLEAVPLGRADVIRPGEDVTVLAMQAMRSQALAAADALASDGIEVEVIDPRSLIPFDFEAVFESVAKTNRLLVVQEGSPFGSWGASLIAHVAEERFEELDAPPRVVGSDETPVPYADELEDLWVPSADRIAAAVRETVLY